METRQNNLFELQIDELSNSYLMETAKWAKFLSILGFVLLGLMLLAGISLAFSFGALLSGSGRSELAKTIGVGVGYILVCSLYFFPCLYLYRFASNMKIALQAGESIQLQTSFKNLKSSFRFVGILTIIVLALYVFAIMASGLFAAFSM